MNHEIEFVVNNHIACHPQMIQQRMEVPSSITVDYSPEYPSIQLIPQDMLKKYILYAKMNIHPIIDNVDQDKIARMYFLMNYSIIYLVMLN